MNIDQAMKIIVKPYITEKTFAMVENESKICFIVERSASKPEIKEAVKTLYKENVTNVNNFSKDVFSRSSLLSPLYKNSLTISSLHC